MNVRESTRSYERWLRRHTSIVMNDLQQKHAGMDSSPFVFMRATFYRWAQVWSTVCPKLADAPEVLAVGDLHVENFGTWRDREGRLVWGVNDVDEAYPLPYTNDLVRLATSALLATRDRYLRLSARDMSAAVLDGYRASLASGGRPIVLAERNRWLRRLAIKQLRNPTAYWNRLRANPPAAPPIPHTALRLLLPEPRLRYQVVHRTAGMGSLGRRRYVAVPKWVGGWIAREAKALVPSAVAWASGDSSGRVYGERLIEQAVRSPDPFFAITDKWVVRRIAPDCVKIEIGDLPKIRDEAKLLRAMGWETANMHLGAQPRRIVKYLDSQSSRWLDRAAADMAQVIVDEWTAWKRR